MTKQSGTETETETGTQLVLLTAVDFLSERFLVNGSWHIPKPDRPVD